jgi:N-acylglucosamine 2-epimerase
MWWLLHRARRLLDDCVPFWFPRCVDEEHGGYLHCVDADGCVVDTDKSVWAQVECRMLSCDAIERNDHPQGRMAWMLLTLYNTVQPKQEYLAWAESGLKFVPTHEPAAAAKPFA